MLSSKENVVFCNVFLSKIHAKSLTKSFWQTNLQNNNNKKKKQHQTTKPQDIILSFQSIQASLLSLLLNLKDRRAILTHNFVFSVLNNTNQKDKPVLTPIGISLPSAWVSTCIHWGQLFVTRDITSALT